MSRVVDDLTLRRIKVKKMFVGEMGMNCFMLAGHEIFYNHWLSDNIIQLNVNEHLQSSKLDSG